jgi:hypothetical protein
MIQFGGIEMNESTLLRQRVGQLDLIVSLIQLQYSVPDPAYETHSTHSTHGPCRR